MGVKSSVVADDDYIEREQYNDLRTDALSSSEGHTHREFESFGGGKQLDAKSAVAAGNFTNAKVADSCLYEENIGNGLVSIKYRTGGDPTDFSADGVTQYEIRQEVIIQVGVSEWSGQQKVARGQTIVFPVPFAAGCRPIVIVTPSKRGCYICDNNSKNSKCTFFWIVIEGGSYASLDFHWIAIGLKA